MAVLNKRAIVMAIEMYGVTAIRLGRTLNPALDVLIKALFTSGEQGFAYDPNDLTTLYQDAAGTIPVTAAGQPVGLLLDKSKGMVLGDEKSQYADGFASLTGLIPVGVTMALEGGSLVATAQAGIARRAEIPVGDLTVGKFYKISFKAYKSSFGSGQHFEQFTAFTKTGHSTSVTSTISTEYSFIMEATAVSGVLRAYAANIEAVGAQIIVEAVSVKELVGNHAYQTVSASRPILQRNVTTGAYYLEFDGTDDFLVTNSIDFTATDKVSLFAGVLKLRDTIQQCLVELSTGANNGSFSLWSPSYTNAKNFAFWSKGTVLNANAFNVGTETGAYVVTGRGDISNKIAALRVNGAQKALSNADQGVGNYGNYPLYIGRRAGTALPFNGHIYSLIGVGRLTTDAETKALEKLIAKNTGVTLNV